MKTKIIFIGWLSLLLGACTPSATSSSFGSHALHEAQLNGQFEQVALIAPLSGRLGPYGRAVRDGFIAARYRHQQSGDRVPQVEVYDSASGNFMSIYRQAVDNGAKFIIGPLQKANLRLLMEQRQLPVPTLALNRIDSNLPLPRGLFQFSLAADDEAVQLADIAYAQHHRRALVIAPDSNWGSEISTAFIERWRQLGGTVAAYTEYTGQGDYAQVIKEALQVVDEGTDNARRRHDIDMIFLLANPQQGHSIKPLLNYYYAADIPVYATSRIYTGQADPRRDSDLDGVQFTDMPWTIGHPSALRNTISQDQYSSKALQDMVAMGIDSFQLYPRLQQLATISGSRVYGETGSLQLNNHGEIERRLSFATFKNGRVVLIPTAN